MEIVGSEVAVYGDTVANFASMNVRIGGPGGTMVLSTRSEGEPVFWTAPVDAPDGTYRYEVVVIVVDEEGAESLVRTRGSFVLESGMIVDQRSSGLWDDTLRVAGDLLDALSDAIIPSAHADIFISSEAPTITFNDLNAEQPEWNITVDGSPSRIVLDDLGSGNTVMSVTTGPNNDASFEVNAEGSIGLGGASVFIDRATGDVGIGTTLPTTSLQINDVSPKIRLVDESSDTNVTLINDFEVFAL